LELLIAEEEEEEEEEEELLLLQLNDKTKKSFSFINDKYL